MISKFLSCVLMLLFVMCVSSLEANAIAKTNAEKELHALFDLEWQARLDRDPMLATQMGLRDSNHLLEDVSEQAYQDWSRKTQAFLQDLARISLDELLAEDQINVQIFKQQLEHRISEIRFKSYQIPFLADSGFHTELMSLANNVPKKNLQDYQNYLARLQQIPRSIEQNIENMRAGLVRKFTMPKIVMLGFTDVIKTTFQSDWETNSFWKPFVDLPASIDSNNQTKLRVDAKKIIQQQVLPAFENLVEFFEQEYIPNAKDSISAADFPQGKEYYAAQISHYTTLDLSADEIHQIGLAEVARIRSEMEEIIEKLEFSGSFKDFLSFLRSSPQFYAKTPLELIKEASYIAKKMDGKLPKLFTKLPRQPYTVEPVPDAIAPKYTTGRYLSAPLNSEKSGTYWVNTYALDKRPLYALEALTLHEAVPGHHLQNALNIELENLPNFRRYSYISAFGEGWGLYCEKLGLEVGFYQDPYSNFGRLTYEMWRAARLVIDTGIHSKKWSREQSIKLLEENSALSTHNIQTEIDRYISWPGQALSYKLGELKIMDLRHRAELALGKDFDIRLFHDAILKNGSIPLGVLEQQIVGFILQREKQILSRTNN